MVFRRASLILRTVGNAAQSARPQQPESTLLSPRAATTSTRSGAILPEPKRTRFGFVGVFFGVVVGLLIGATLSKMMANFLEEKELFVPSDDDDDDDDDD